MPFTGNRWTSNKVVSLHEILETVNSRYSFLPVQGEAHDTAKHYTVPGHAGTFAVISTMSEPFCGSCNRMRLTSDGKLKNCLFSQSETDLLSALRRGEDVTPLIHSPLSKSYHKLAGLTHFLKGIYNGQTATPLDGQESYRMHSYARDNCLIQIDESVTECAAGTVVDVLLLPE